jgi:hypothetical protein
LLLLLAAMPLLPEMVPSRLALLLLAAMPLVVPPRLALLLLLLAAIPLVPETVLSRLALLLLLAAMPLVVPSRLALLLLLLAAIPLVPETVPSRLALLPKGPRERRLERTRTRALLLPLPHLLLLILLWLEPVLLEPSAELNRLQLQLLPKIAKSRTGRLMMMMMGLTMQMTAKTTSSRSAAYSDGSGRKLVF